MEAKTSPGDSQPSSVVTYELPLPPPEMVDLPAHDVEEELEWVSRIMDGSLSDVPAPSQPLALLRPLSKKSKHGKGGGKHKPKKRGRKPKHAPQLSGAGSPGDRRCSHCDVQKTLQWRAGAQGAKTLCNACGVRYKSGRLLPEYRPSSIHSNSHRKVLEMHRKKDAGILATAAPAVASF